MKILETSLEGGRTILNPVQVSKIFTNDKTGGAGGVLTPKDLIISTISCYSHHDCVNAHGMEDINDIFMNRENETRLAIGEKDLRLQLGHDNIEIEFWLFEEWSNKGEGNFDYNDLSITSEELSELEAWVLNHPRIKLAYGKTPPAITMSLRDESDPVYEWSNGELKKVFEEETINLTP